MPRNQYLPVIFLLIFIIISGGYWLYNPSFTLTNLLCFIFLLMGLALIGAIIYYRIQSRPVRGRATSSSRFRVISRDSELAQQSRTFSIPHPLTTTPARPACQNKATGRGGPTSPSGGSEESLQGRLPPEAGLKSCNRVASGDRRLPQGERLSEGKGRLFGTAGIRGLTNIQITPLLALKIAQVFSDYLGNSGQLEHSDLPAHYSWQYPDKSGLPHYKGTVAIGCDTRYGVQMLMRATSSGLMSGGINVIDCGCIPTGGLACFVLKNQLAGGIMITGSHTPYQMTGIIMMLSDGTYLSNDVARELERSYHQYEKRQVTIRPEEIGQYKTAERPLETYQDFLLGLVDQDLIRSKNYKVLVDPCNGTASLVLPALLKSLGCEVVLNNEALCPIPNRPAEPRATNLGPTALKVKEQHCHLGIATDIDADRVLFIDEAGKVLSEDLTGAIFARSILETTSSKKVCVTPINSSGLIEKTCTGLGQELVYCPIGAPETLRVIKELKASFGYEESGKYYFADDVLWADGILASLKLLEIMAQKNKSLSELAVEFPPFYQVKHTIRCSEKLKDKIMERVWHIWEKEALKERVKDITLDGLKRVYPDGAWLLIRRSGTEPLIRVYADAPSARRAEELVKLGEDMVQRAFKEI